MNAKNDFDSISRVMRSPARTNGVRTRSLSLEESSVTTLELPERKHIIELGSKMTIDDPAKDVPGHIERIRSAVVELDQRGELRGETLGRVVADLDLVKKIAENANRLAMAAADRMPDRADSEGKAKSLKHLSLSFQGKTRREGQGHDPTIFAAFKGVSDNHYGLLANSCESLGIDDKTTRAKVERFKRLNDVMVCVALAKMASSDAGFVTNGGMRSLPWYEEHQQLAQELMLAMGDTPSTGGGNFVPTQILSSNFMDIVELQLRFMGVFQSVAMPGPTYAFPVKGSHAKGYAIAENIADDGSTANATLIASSIVTNIMTLVAKKIGALVIPSTEWEEDAVVNVPSFIQQDGALAIARALEDWGVNGQKTATIDGTAPSATDTKSYSDGIRAIFKRQVNGASPQDFGTGLTAEGLAAMIGSQKAYGADPSLGVWLMSTSGFARCLTLKAADGSKVVLTMNELGQMATILRGQLGQIYGAPLILSEFVSDVMDANGYIPAAPGTRTAIYRVYTPAFKVGVRRGVIATLSRDYRFVQDQLVFKFTARYDFQQGYDLTNTLNRPVAAGVNLATF